MSFWWSELFPFCDLRLSSMIGWKFDSLRGPITEPMSACQTRQTFDESWKLVKIK